MRLLEREDEVAALEGALATARAGRGSVVLVAGEAGIGKSSLVERWLGDVTDAAVHVGWCDDLLTARALGPLHDIARHAGDELAAAVASGVIGDVLEAVLALLDHPLRSTVLVLEDLHWADEATLDVVRYVGRRIEPLPAVLVGTYRDDEVGPRHPLTGALAAVGRTRVHRLMLRPLSRAAVTALAAGSGHDPELLHETTGGNPFFVDEVLEAQDVDVPRSVVDSVLVRLYGLQPDTRIAVERLAVVPGRVDADLVAVLAVGEPSVLAEAERRGLITAGPAGGVAFRHDLTRQAVLESMTAVDRSAANRLVLDHLVSAGVTDAARLLHHAVGAGDSQAVVEYGTRAADEAFDAGAFRAAATAHGHVLANDQLLSPDEAARVLTRDAWALHNLQRFGAAAARAEEAVARYREIGDDHGTVRALRVLVRARYVTVDSAGALAAAEEAVEVAERTADAEVRAEAAVARLEMWSLLDRAELAAAAWPDLLAEVRATGRTDLESLTLNYGAVATILTGGDGDEATSMLERSIAIARAHDHHEEAARAYTNIVGAALLRRRHDDAMRWLEEGLEHTADHDLAYFRFTMLAHRGTRLLDVGRFGEAEGDLRTLIDSAPETGVLVNTAARGLARAALRRGDDDATRLLDLADELAARSEATQYTAPVAVLRVEQAFLHDDPEAAAGATQAALAIAGAGAWAHGEALAWCKRAGAPLPEGWSSHTVHDEWAHVLHGRWADAAALARADGRSYDHAMALLDSGDPDRMLEALATLDRIGAAPAVRIARRRLRAAGVRSIPRGAIRATRDDPAGLTPRQLEVLPLLGEGLTNAEIAGRLVVSRRTVDNHVGAILRKLGVASRHEAVAAHTTLVESQHG